jgi:hypothetical protein
MSRKPAGDADRQVRKLIARGPNIRLADALDVCRFKTLLAANRSLIPADIAQVTSSAVILGFECEYFSVEMRDKILADLRTGHVVLLMSNRRELRDWRPWSQPNNSLIGHATIAFTGGWTVSSIPIFRRADGSLSAGVPNAAQLDGEGRVKLRDGKRVYTAVITFADADARSRWNRAVLGALADAGIGGAGAVAS